MPAQAARVLALAFDPEVSPAEDATSERVLDAALELAAAHGLQHLTMDEVAQRAGVGRMTVYRRFGSRTALVDGLAVRECRRCLERIAAAIDPAAPAGERIAAQFTETLAVIREHPLLAHLAQFEPESLLRELTRDDSAVFRLVREFLIGLIAEGQRAGELLPGDPAVHAELALRLSASFVLMPDSVLPLDDEHATREAIRALITPMLPRHGRR
ncbi:MAG TPA: TetR/AcrR family transcriptional regulator [Solirubrobacteraceae bacterium]|jgi:AcrR family transcriptional regulator